MNNSIFQQIATEIANNNSAWLVTVTNSDGSTPGKVGFKMLVKDDGSIIGTIGGGTIEKLVIEKIIKIAPTKPDLWSFDLGGNLTGEKTGMLCGGLQTILVDPIIPNHNLYIIGGGHCGKALCELAAKCNFNVTVIDERSEHANQINHPLANKIITATYSEIDKHIKFSTETFIVIMTHSHKNDELIMRKVLGKSYKYLGMIGSKAKSNTIYNNLLQDNFRRDELEKAFFPIGLNIGSQTPYEIAISILAQLIAVKNDINEIKFNTNSLLAKD